MAAAPKKETLERGVRPGTLKKLRWIKAVQDQHGTPVNWLTLVGKGVFEILTTIPPNILGDQDQIDAATTRLDKLLGTHAATKMLLDQDGTCTGEVCIRVDPLSEEGARRLNRGYWTTLKETDTDKDQSRGFFMLKSTIIDTSGIQSYVTDSVDEQYREFWWDYQSANCPSKGAVYEAVARHVGEQMTTATGPSLRVVDGSVSTEENEKKTTKANYGAGWIRGQQRGFIHAAQPAFGIAEPGTTNVTYLSHGIDKRDPTKMAKKDPGCYKIRFPKEFAQEVTQGIGLAAEELEIAIHVEMHHFPNFCLRDGIQSFKQGRIVRGTKGPGGAVTFADDPTRAVIRAVSTATSTDLGITDPVELRAHLRVKCGVQAIAVFYQEELKHLAETPEATVYSFWALVNRGDPTTMMKVANPMVAWTPALTMRMWNRSDTLEVKDRELHVAEGRLSVVPQKVKAAEQTTSMVGIFTNITESAKKEAGRKGVQQSGYEDGLATKVQRLAEMQRRNDEHELDHKLEQEQERMEAWERRQREKYQGQQEEQPTEQTKAESPKRGRPTAGEVQVAVETERAEQYELTVDIDEISSDGKPSLNDLAAYLWENGALGEGAGINPELLPEEFAHGITLDHVALTVNLEMQFTPHAGGQGSKQWRTVVGKDPGTGLKRLTNCKDGLITVRPVPTTRKPPSWAPWMHVTVPPFVPSPAKPQVSADRGAQRLSGCRQTSPRSLHTQTSSRRSTPPRGPHQQPRTAQTPRPRLYARRKTRRPKPQLRTTQWTLTLRTHCPLQRSRLRSPWSSEGGWKSSGTRKSPRNRRRSEGSWRIGAKGSPRARWRSPGCASWDLSTARSNKSSALKTEQNKGCNKLSRDGLSRDVIATAVNKTKGYNKSVMTSVIVIASATNLSTQSTKTKATQEVGGRLLATGYSEPFTEHNDVR
jgi:hypothetical protein